MTVKTITYFDEAGSKNTDETLRLAHKRAVELGIRDVVVASSHGETALKTAKIFGAEKTNIVAVTLSEGFRSEGWTMTPEERKRLQDKGVKVFTGTLALGGDVDSAFSDKQGGATINEAVCETLYRFCQGMKVAVEVVLMTADAGLIPVDREVIAVAGTGKGADTVVVVQPACPRKFLYLKIKEIVAKPREG